MNPNLKAIDVKPKNGAEKFHRNGLEEKFDAEKYEDQYQAKLQMLIERKAKGQKIELPALEKMKETQDSKLLSALEDSLKALKKK